MPTGVTIKAFGYISSLLGAREVVVRCDNHLTVRAILAQLRESYPLFSNYVNKLDNVDEELLIVRNGKIETLDSMINPGEELVFVTPISGG
jgi:molybdopterin converting factor small subunit